MQTIMACPARRCDGQILLIRTIIKRSVVTKIETESYVVGCDTCTLRQFVEFGGREMSPPEIERLSKPEECGYEHG
jgi:hypothetical protein